MPFARPTIRIGVTGLARAGKTAMLTSMAANLLALGAGLPALPALSQRLQGRGIRVSVAPAGADPIPRFDYPAHLAALAADPPRWPARTDAVSLLALDVEIGRAGLAAALPPTAFRLELVDYPGEWLLDLPLLEQGFPTWSAAALARLQGLEIAAPFLGFVQGMPAQAAADETLAATGHALYRALLTRLRDECGLALLQPGRFLMPPPGPAPPWMAFFPLPGRSRLASLLADRYDRYRDSARRELRAPGFGRIDRLVVLADVLGALHAGPAAFADAAAALDAAARALRWSNVAVPAWLAQLVPALGGIRRVAFAAAKSDHVAERQRANLKSLVARLTQTQARGPTAAFALASVRCTEDIVWQLEGHPISAVRGRLIGADRLARSYPGEVPSDPPDAGFWTHPFLSLPDFEPLRLPLGGRGGVPHIRLDELLVFLLEDLLP